MPQAFEGQAIHLAGQLLSHRLELSHEGSSLVELAKVNHARLVAS